MKLELNADKNIVRYLLGDLPEHEQMRLEDQYLADAEFFDRFLIIEDQLIDDYLRNQLTNRVREQFENHFLRSPRRRERVEFARALLKAVSKPSLSSSALASSSTGLNSSLLTFFRNLSATTRFPLATFALVILLGGTWLMVENVRLRNQVELLRAGQATLLEREKDLQQELASARNDQTAQQPQPEPKDRDLQVQQANQPPSRPSLLSFVLTPGLQRSGGGMNRLVIPQSMRSLQIKLNFETSDEYTTYAVMIKTAEANEVWRQNNLQAISTKSGRVVVLTLPARILPKGEYVVSLSGITASGDAESIEDYTFSVVRE
jgi:hypothetical protein